MTIINTLLMFVSHLFRTPSVQSEREEKPASHEVSNDTNKLSLSATSNDHLTSSESYALRRRRIFAKFDTPKTDQFSKTSLNNVLKFRSESFKSLIKEDQNLTAPNVRGDTITSTTTDLDIQFGKLRSDRLKPRQTKISGKSVSFDKSQSLTQYCNFDEKKIVKVAPHIRKKDVICDTVDVWSRIDRIEAALVRKKRFKPLIFGGTYPIDAPFASRPTNFKVFKVHKSSLVQPKYRSTFRIDEEVSK